jgi:hypothetical protein
MRRCSTIYRALRVLLADRPQHRPLSEASSTGTQLPGKRVYTWKHPALLQLLTR